MRWPILINAALALALTACLGTTVAAEAAAAATGTATTVPAAATVTPSTAVERAPVVAVPAVVKPGSFTALAYHEVQRDVRDFPDPFAVDATAVVKQFEWLRGNGYTPVSLDDILTARNGGKPLPDKAVLLSFDDAYRSFYTRVYPLLREFRYPAVVGVVGKWTDTGRGEPVPRDEKAVIPDSMFATWAQLREMAASGLVEIASHTYDLHRGVPANPEGNLQPAATARIYSTSNGRYENDAEWRARAGADLARNSDVIARETGRRPRAIIWPYGSYNNELVGMAGKLGMPVALTLEDGANTADVPLTAVRRILIENNPVLADFTTGERGPLYAEPVRVVQARLDDVYSPDPAQQERNLSILLDRIKLLEPTHVYLQATTDSNGDGIADSAYFPNRHLPLRSDLFNRAAWQIETRNHIKVFAVLPVTGFGLSKNSVAEIYEDLARYVDVGGLVFDDPEQPGAIADQTTLDFTRQLAQRVGAFRAPLKTVRTLNIDLTADNAPGTVAAQHNAQKVAVYVAAYDYVVLVMTPREPSVNPDALMAALGLPAAEAQRDRNVRRKLVFMLQNTAQSTDPAARQMRALQLGGALNFGYAPDDFLHNNPPLEKIAPVMSLRVYPQAAADKEKQK